MDIIKVIVVEDDNVDFENLKSILKSFKEIKIIDRCTNIQEAIDSIKEKKPDLIFLDIELGEKEKGYNILKHFGNLDFEVIFTTSHVKYAQDAFDANAVHNLQKPLNTDLIYEALNRFKKRVRTEDYITNELLSIKNAISLMQSPPTNDTKVRLEVRGEIIFRQLKEFSVFQADGDFTVIYFTNGDRLTDERGLKELCNQFRLFPFKRVHRGWMIYPYNIKKFTTKNGNQFMMEGYKDSVPLGRTFRMKILTELGLK